MPLRAKEPPGRALSGGLGVVKQKTQDFGEVRRSVGEIDDPDLVGMGDRREHHKDHGPIPGTKLRYGFLVFISESPMAPREGTFRGISGGGN